MRFASVDNRSRSMWLLAGLGVLIWVAFSVLFGGSSAHADETPAHPSLSQSQQHDQKQHDQKQLAQKQHAQKHAHKQRTQPHRQAISRVLHKSPLVVKASKKLETRAVAESLQKQATKAIERSAEKQHQDPQSARAWGHHKADKHPAHKADKHQANGNRNHHAHSRHANPHAAKHAEVAHPVIRTQHRAPAAAARTAPIVKDVAVAAVPASDLPAEGAPVESHSTSTEHPPAAPLTASSNATGQTSPACDLPGAAKMGDLLGLLLTAAHADDDVLPTGPVGTTDDSPD